MLTDRFGLAVSTTSQSALAAYVEGCDALLTLYPGATTAFDRAIAADPDFALAYVAKARAEQVAGDVASARATFTNVGARVSGLGARELSQIEVFRLLFAGQSMAALAAVRAHLDTWPRDALVLSTAANQIGLIGMSGGAGREQELVTFLDGLERHYGDDWWFDAHYSMALSEICQQAKARPRLERSMAQNPRNAYAAHAMGHLCYEEGEHAAAISFMHSWLPNYPREAVLYGHLHWHLALSELQSGNVTEGFRLFNEVFAANNYTGPALLKLVDAASFLWRTELAGEPPDPTRWRLIHEFAQKMFPKPGAPMADWHVALADAAIGDGAALEARAREMEDMLRADRFPCGPAVPALLRGFAAFQRQDFSATIEAIEPVLPERERICGSRAQVDLIEFTLLKAYLNEGRLDDVRRMLKDRRPGPKGIPVAGLPAFH